MDHAGAPACHGFPYIRLKQFLAVEVYLAALPFRNKINNIAGKPDDPLDKRVILTGVFIV
jgi:hypothetical protein